MSCTVANAVGRAVKVLVSAFRVCVSAACKLVVAVMVSVAAHMLSVCHIVIAGIVSNLLSLNVIVVPRISTSPEPYICVVAGSVSIKILS